ncbi:contact-dependent growth inhibition system immunity protein [Dyella tabacisoli]|uniref:CdiI immunity protein domain-containing protein n=1 Tax=Dyella tabacisoli TaxID=2282381 RepID=A0A369UGB5_9GAMM|nr:contact-dependent growth inhibition system immunity protein [Dyella tabacisoli]RDD79772.1 hypothetical protein DVJ77_20560 [Dyella tabacisoli]
MTYEKLDALGQLLGCYFHQDWPDEFESDAVALRAIVESEPREQISSGVREIDGLLADPPSESALREILVDKVGCYFDPSSQGLSCEQWLRHVRDVFAKA